MAINVECWIDVLLHHAAIAFPLNKRLDINVKPYIMLEAIYVYAADAAAALKGN